MLIWKTDWIGIALIGKRSGMGQIEVELIGYWSVFFFIPTKLDLYTIVFRSTRSLLNHYPIISRWLLQRLASRSLLESFEHAQNFRVGSRSDAEQPSKLDHPDHFCRASSTSPRLLARAWSSWFDRQWELTIIYEPKDYCNLYQRNAIKTNIFKLAPPKFLWKLTHPKNTYSNWHTYQ